MIILYSKDFIFNLKISDEELNKVKKGSYYEASCLDFRLNSEE
jgi:hypothetical protein